jgi:hypothetical protein
MSTAAGTWRPTPQLRIEAAACPYGVPSCCGGIELQQLWEDQGRNHEWRPVEVTPQAKAVLDALLTGHQHTAQ